MHVHLTLHLFDVCAANEYVCLMYVQLMIKYVQLMIKYARAPHPTPV